jgi:putative oligomerization/nucleic acid binding protein
MPDLSWRSKRRLKSLREHGGKSALATVVEFDKRWAVPESGYGGIPLGHSEHYTLKIRVEPAGEPSFETEIKEHDFFVTNSEQPMAGSQFAVVYDPDDHSNVVRDPLDADSVVPRQHTELKLKPAEEDLFRKTVFANLEKMRASGELNEQQYQDKRAQVEAEFAPEPPAGAPPARDTAAQLTDLAALHDRGVLSDAEFQAQKAKLLGEA